MTTDTVTTRLSAQAVRPLRTLDPAAPTDDLDWLDEAIGDARVVAIGESAHYNREAFRLRDRLLRHLAERHGFGAYAMETGFVEARQVDAWVRGTGTDTDAGQVAAQGLTSLMGLWTEMRDHLAGMRRRNATAAQPVSFHGIDLPGSNASLLPGLDAFTAYLADADPGFTVDPALRQTAAAFAATSAFSAQPALTAYLGLTAEAKDALTAGLADLAARMAGRRLEYRRRTGDEAYRQALRALHLTAALDTTIRAMVRGDQQAALYDRDAAIADTLQWILDREDRVVLAAHNGHVQRWPTAFPGVPGATPMGMHLADSLGSDYLAIGMTSGQGQMLNVGADFVTGTLFAPMDPPRPGSLDALLHASHDGPFATDLRRLDDTDTAAVRAATSHRAGNGPFYADIAPLHAFDLLIHLPQLTPATPDPAALAHAPDDVQRPFTHWASTI
ncbi:erythromycin esterase family protein [Spirillospora sp. CA-108201]